LIEVLSLVRDRFRRSEPKGAPLPLLIPLSLNLYERGTLDANHPLAGKTLVVDGELVEIS